MHKSPRDVLAPREWHALQRLGVSTIDDLVGVDVANAEFRARSLPEVTHVNDPVARLEVAIRRASMIRSGAQLERETTGSIDVPRADLEIDFDIEWDVENRVYLWGAGQQSRRGSDVRANHRLGKTRR